MNKKRQQRASFSTPFKRVRKKQKKCSKPKTRPGLFCAAGRHYIPKKKGRIAKKKKVLNFAM